MFIGVAQPLLPGCSPAGVEAVGLSTRTLGAVGQPVLAVGHDLLADRDALGDHRDAVLRRRDLERPPLDGVVGLDDVAVGAVGALHDGALRHRDRVLAGRELQADADELAGPQLLVRVLEGRLQPQRAGRRCRSGCRPASPCPRPACRCRRRCRRRRSAPPSPGSCADCRLAYCGTVKFTKIGLIWVIVTSVVSWPACTRLPRSTSRWPVRPSIGARTSA